MPPFFYFIVMYARARSVVIAPAAVTPVTATPVMVMVVIGAIIITIRHNDAAGKRNEYGTQGQQRKAEAHRNPPFLSGTWNVLCPLYSKAPLRDGASMFFRPYGIKGVPAMAEAIVNECCWRGCQKQGMKPMADSYMARCKVL